jgi:Uma2 family endonuclease
MDSELEPVEGTTEAGVTEVEEDREGCELVDGVWVPKHPDEPPAEDDREGCELIDGVWVEKAMSNAAAVVESNLNFAVKGHVRLNRLGLVFSSEGRYQLVPNQPKQTRKPDLSFVSAGRLPGNQVPRGWMQLAPDLAVEVVSPTDTADGVETKLDEYLRAGVRLVWVVNIPTRNVWAYRPDGAAKLYRAADTLPGEDVLPGFTVPVAELFEGL